MESLAAWRTRDDCSWSFYHRDVCWWEAAHGKNNGWQWHWLEHVWSSSDIQQLSAAYYRPTWAVSFTINSCYNLLGLGISISVTNDLQIWNDTHSLQHLVTLTCEVQHLVTLTCEVHQVVSEAAEHSCCTNGHFQPFHSRWETEMQKLIQVQVAESNWQSSCILASYTTGQISVTFQLCTTVNIGLMPT